METLELRGWDVMGFEPWGGDGHLGGTGRRIQMRNAIVPCIIPLRPVVAALGDVLARMERSSAALLSARLLPS